MNLPSDIAGQTLPMNTRDVPSLEVWKHAEAMTARLNLSTPSAPGLGGQTRTGLSTPSNI